MTIRFHYPFLNQQQIQELQQEGFGVSASSNAPGNNQRWVEVEQSLWNAVTPIPEPKILYDHVTCYEVVASHKLF